MYLVESSEIVAEPQEPTPLVLNLFRSASGLWSGEMFCGDECIATIGGCVTPREVQQAAFASKLFADRICFV